MDKNKILESAYMNFRDKKYDQAIEEYKRIISEFPSEVNVLNILGDISGNLGKISDALNYYDRAIEILNSSEDKNKIDIILKKMLRLDPESVEDFNLKKENKDKSEDIGYDKEMEIKALKQAIVENPQSYENYQKLGDILEKAGRKIEASEQYFVLGNVLYNNRVFKKAEIIFQKIVKLNPNNIQAHIILSEIYTKSASNSEAKKELLFIAARLIREGDLEKGQFFAQKAIQLKSIEAHFYLGLVYYQLNRLEDAKTELITLLKFKINHKGSLTHLANIYLINDQLLEAIELLERLVKLEPENPEAIKKLGEIFIARGELDKAAEKLDQAIDIFAKQEEWEQASFSAYQLLKINEGNQEPYLKLAETSYNAGLEKIAAETCISLANILEQAGNMEEAQQMRIKASEIMGEEIKSEPVSNNVSNIAIEEPGVIDLSKMSSDPKIAMEENQPIPEITPEPRFNMEASPKESVVANNEESLKTLMNLAENYIKQDSLDEAIQVYEKILKTDPNNQEVQAALTKVYAKFAGIRPTVESKPMSTLDNKEEEPAVVEPEVASQEQNLEQKNYTHEAKGITQQTSFESIDTVQKQEISSKQKDIYKAMEDSQADELAGDQQDEFMTVTVAEIYTKQGLLNEALKIYEKILEIEPGNIEAQNKMQELKKKLAEKTEPAKKNIVSGRIITSPEVNNLGSEEAIRVTEIEETIEEKEMPGAVMGEEVKATSVEEEIRESEVGAAVESQEMPGAVMGEEVKAISSIEKKEVIKEEGTNENQTIDSNNSYASDTIIAKELQTEVKKNNEDNEDKADDNISDNQSEPPIGKGRRGKISYV